MAPAQTLLVVDDDPTVRLLTSSGLKKRGYQVIQAVDAEQALRLMQENSPDLALVDVSMPGRNGFEFVQAVRNGEAGTAHRERPLLMLTGSDDVKSIDQAFTSGATDFITKPINLPLLVERVKYALRGAEREKALREAQMEQASACKLARLGFWQLNFSNDALTWSEDAAEVLNCAALPESRQALLGLLNDTDALRLNTALEAAREGQDGLNLEVTLYLGHSERVVRLQSDPETQEGHLIGAFQDVTALRAFEDKALYLAEYDDLTDLPKRRLFLNLLDEQLTDRKHMIWSIGVIDISRLHRINDALGIEAGDQVLAIFAQRLKQSLGHEALMCRLEADTFAVAIPHADNQQMQAYHHHWMQPLARAQKVKGEEIFVDFTAGVSLYPQDGGNSDELLRTALLAQRFCRYHAANQKVMFYQDVESFDDSNALSLENDLRKALGNQEFFLVYQPQQQLSNSRFIGVEALLRWRHPARGVVSPGDFIPLLEESGLIIDVGDWVAEEACRQLAQWQAEGVEVAMAINISARQFEQAGLAKRIARHVTRYGIKPQQLELEITESTAMSNPEATLATLHELKKLGFKLAIDDFGTGHSSYEYLLRFPLDTLKIDRSFIIDVAEARQNRAIVRSLTALSQGLGLKTVAEGVETQRQRDYLDALDVDDVQGFLLARPMEPQACLAFLHEHAKAGVAN
ncbi:MAG: putative bifunctional diguanylate cyclase/phosphodiesterase [Pseudomonadota bacterium]